MPIFIILTIAVFVIVLLSVVTILSIPKLGTSKVATGKLRTAIDSCAEGAKNCVSSSSSNNDCSIPFLNLNNSYTDENFSQLITALVCKHFKAKVILTAETYVHFEVLSPKMRFADDLEIKKIAGELQAEVKSCARLGKLDFGANKARVEKIQELLIG